jgi:hypothetical protein
MIRVFPGVPDSWPDVVFHKLLAEGAFEVSARRKDRKTVFVQVHDAKGRKTHATDLQNGPLPLIHTTSSDRKVGLERASGRSCLLLLPDDMLASEINAEPSSVTLEPVPGNNGRAVRVNFPATGVSTVVITKTAEQPSPSDLVIKPLPGTKAAYNYWGTDRPNSQQLAQLLPAAEDRH